MENQSLLFDSMFYFESMILFPPVTYIFHYYFLVSIGYFFTARSLNVGSQGSNFAALLNFTLSLGKTTRFCVSVTSATTVMLFFPQTHKKHSIHGTHYPYFHSFLISQALILFYQLPIIYLQQEGPQSCDLKFPSIKSFSFFFFNNYFLPIL